MKRKMILLISLLLIAFDVHALTYSGCEYSDVSRLKSLVGNVNISYSYHVLDNQIYFDVTLNNITEDMYFKDYLTNKTYYYSDTQNGEITIYNYYGSKGNYQFYSYLPNCKDVSLGKKYYSFPSYNIYYNDPLCSDLKSYSLCQKWANVTYSYDEFSSKIEEYKQSLEKKDVEEEVIEYKKSVLDEVISFYVKYYYYIFGAIILICGSIVLIKRKKDSFKL